jgi:hypothetical protein
VLHDASPSSFDFGAASCFYHLCRPLDQPSFRRERWQEEAISEEMGRMEMISA